MLLSICLTVRGTGPGVIINEIAAYEASGYEWIEVYNAGTTDIAMDGWKFWEQGVNHSITSTFGNTMTLAPGAYAVIVQDPAKFLEHNAGFSGKIFDSAWTSLSESGEEVGLKDGSGNFIEQFTYIPIQNFSLERKNTALADYTVANWMEHVSGSTPGRENDAVHGNQNPPEDPDQGGGHATSTPVIVVINEVLPNPASGGKEWIELYNLSSHSGDLSNWVLEDATNSAIATVTTTIPANGFLLIELASARLNNSGDTVRLKDSFGVVADEMAYGTNAGNAPIPGQGNSVARKIDGGDTGNDANDFAVTTAATPQAPNSIIAPPAPSPPPAPPASSSGPSTAGSSYTASYYPRDILFNELSVAGDEDGVEWIELYNATSNAIPLLGWWVDDGSHAKTALSGTIEPKKFFVIERPNGSLNNAGDLVTLYDPTGKAIDKVTYGAWSDGNIADNANTALGATTLARVVDGQDTDADRTDFAVTSVMTKGAANSIVASSGEQRGAEMSITEIFANPFGSDVLEEFIELKNVGATSTNLLFWKVGDETSFRLTISTTTVVLPGAYTVLKRAATGIALENAGGDEVRLYAPNGMLADRVSYTGDVVEGRSYAKKNDDVWAWTASSTPGKDNIFEGVNMPPRIALDLPKEAVVSSTVLFDASDTTDLEQDAMAFFWDFGDGTQARGDAPRHVYAHTGKYMVHLAVADTRGNTSTESWTMTVQRPEDMEFRLASGTIVRDLVISEIFSDPLDSEEKEFIELFNPTDQPVDVSGYFLDDDDGGSSPHRIPNGIILPPKGYRAFMRTETKIALNNSSDAARLLSPGNEVIDEVSYDDTQKGLSYARYGDDWRWGAPTPGEEIKEIVKLRNSSIVATGQVKGVKIAGATTIEMARQAAVGSWVRVTGTVAVLPGVYGTQYFYIVGSPGIQVYMNKKDFPALAVGDKITVAGEISEVSGEKRIKVKQKGDIAVVGHGDAPAGSAMEAAEIDDGMLGTLLTITGEITQLKSTLMYVDDGSDEMEVYFKKGAGIRRDAMRPGDRVSVTGMLVKTKDGYRLLPRSQKDIVKAGVVAGQKIVNEDMPQSRWKQIDSYLTMTVVGLALLLAALYLRSHGKRVEDVLKRLLRK